MDFGRTCLRPTWPLFQLPTPFDAAYCTFNSFRLLLTEQAGAPPSSVCCRKPATGRHYVLGFHLLPLDASEESIERWTRGMDRRKSPRPCECFPPIAAAGSSSFGLVCLCAGAKVIRLRDEFSFRMYTASQFRRLLATVPSLELCDVYDFWYEIDHPLEFNDDRADTVFILRKRAGGRNSVS